MTRYNQILFNKPRTVIEDLANTETKFLEDDHSKKPAKKEKWKKEGLPKAKEIFEKIREYSRDVKNRNLFNLSKTNEDKTSFAITLSDKINSKPPTKKYVVSFWGKIQKGITNIGGSIRTIENGKNSEPEEFTTKNIGDFLDKSLMTMHWFDNFYKEYQEKKVKETKEKTKKGGGE